MVGRKFIYELLSKIHGGASFHPCRASDRAGVAMYKHRSGATAAAKWDDAGSELSVPQRYRCAGDDHAGGADLRLHDDRPREENLCPRRERGAGGAL